jgi:hypothetical protein
VPSRVFFRFAVSVFGFTVFGFTVFGFTVFGFTSVLLSPQLASAQSLLEQEVEKAYHSKKKTSNSFVLRRPLLVPFEGAPKTTALPGYLLSDSLLALPSEAGTYDGLPLCTKSQKRLIARPEKDTSFPSLDIVAYQFDNERHIKNAKPLGAKALPYIEGALTNPFRPRGDTEQTVLRILGLQCLPTRVQSVRKNGEKFFEYSEGSLAWK